MASVQATAFVDMQTDGNLCVYRGSSPSSNAGMLWCSGSKGAALDASMQGDGNLCVRSAGEPSPVWCSNTNVPGCTDCPFFAQVSDEGHGLCVYRGFVGEDHSAALWCSNGVNADS